MFNFTLHTITTLFIISYANTYERTSEHYELKKVSISSMYQLENHLPQVEIKF